MTAPLVLAALTLAFLPAPTYRLLRALLATARRLAGAGNHGRARSSSSSAVPRASPVWHAMGPGGGSGLGRPVLIVVDARRRKGGGR